MITPSVIDIMNEGLNIVLQNDLLKLNENSFEYGLKLSKEDVEIIVEWRETSLKHMGRIDLGIDVTKKIVEFIYKSQYTNREDYLEAVVDLQDIFYYLKNETLELISDDDAIELISDMHETFCGEIKNIQAEVEDYSKKFKFNLEG
ncbi:hypothetical protein KQI18_05600 [Clostridioides mangenotii]|uniref:DUF6323 family protein n=1 Tax=Metaclostridioides mangenotii TaxID=1540 RepID=UPI001C106C37|nr:DUF6323 family protein [Clostridioides mangenotii]MBU5307256.1 hypothetical protein [Clostridioides mangenotii]